MADVVWLQAVQVAGNKKLTPAEYDRLYVLLNVEADLDPKFEIPYFLGGLVLGESPQHGREALRVFERGKATHPADWRFPFYIGFTHYFSLGDAAGGWRGDGGGGAVAREPGLPAGACVPDAVGSKGTGGGPSDCWSRSSDRRATRRGGRCWSAGSGK